MKTAEERADRLRQQVNSKVLWGSNDHEVLDWLEQQHGIQGEAANELLNCCSAESIPVSDSFNTRDASPVALCDSADDGAICSDGLRLNSHRRSRLRQLRRFLPELVPYGFGKNGRLRRLAGAFLFRRTGSKSQ